MKLLRLYIFFIFIVSALFAGAQIQPGAKPQTVVIRAGTLLDGKGHELHNMFMNAKKQAPLTAFPARCPCVLFLHLTQAVVVIHRMTRVFCPNKA